MYRHFRKSPCEAVFIPRNYKDVPYHCFAHACDVLHTVFRLSSLSMGSYWMREVDQLPGMIVVDLDISAVGELDEWNVE